VVVTVAAAARPPLVLPLVIVAAEVFDEFQVTEVVMSMVPPPDMVPKAVNCWVWPERIDGFVGVTAIETKLPGTTVTLVEPLTVPEAAVMVVVPAPTPVTRAVLLLTDAIVVCDDDQLAVIGEVVPSLKVPVAVICTVHTEPEGHVGGVPVSAVMVGVSGVTVIAVNAGFTQKSAQPARVSNAIMAKTRKTSTDRP